MIDIDINCAVITEETEGIVFIPSTSLKDNMDDFLKILENIFPKRTISFWYQRIKKTIIHKIIEVHVIELPHGNGYRVAFFVNNNKMLPINNITARKNKQEIIELLKKL